MKLSVLFVFTSLLICSCANYTAQEISDAKQQASICLRESKGSESSCLAKDSKVKLGFKCENVQVTGTRLPQRICTTLAQREAKRKSSKEMVDKMQRAGQPLEGN